MKTTTTIRAAPALGLSLAIARGLGRMRRLHRVLLARAGHKVGQGNGLTTAILLAAYMAS